MKLKFSSIEIEGDLLPHDKNEVDQFKELSFYIYESIKDTDYIDIEIDDNIINLLSFLTTKLIEGITDNIYANIFENKGAKYLSGDVSLVVSEALTYASLNSLYKVHLTNIIPFRSVKYLGTIVDAMIDISKEEELRRMLGASKGFLFINIRASMTPRSYYIVDKLAKSLMNLEVVRYPNNYGLISIITKDNTTIKENFVFVK